MNLSKRILVSGLLLICATSSGCMSIGSRVHEWSLPYSGTRACVHFFSAPDLFTKDYLLIGLDFPLSLALDTALLPVDMIVWACGGAIWYTDEARTTLDPGRYWKLTGCAVKAPVGERWSLRRLDDDTLRFDERWRRPGRTTQAVVAYHREQSKDPFGGRTFENVEDLLKHVRETIREPFPKPKDAADSEFRRDSVSLITLNGAPAVLCSSTAHGQLGPENDRELRQAEFRRVILLHPKTRRPISIQMFRITTEAEAIEGFESLAEGFFAGLRFEDVTESGN